MPIFSVSTIRAGPGGARGDVFAVPQRPASPLASFLAGLLGLAAIVLVLALFLLILIPAVAAALAVALCAAVARTVRRALRNTTAPNGVLDGRRNVRVVVRGDGEP